MKGHMKGDRIVRVDDDAQTAEQQSHSRAGNSALNIVKEFPGLGLLIEHVAQGMRDRQVRLLNAVVAACLGRGDLSPDKLNEALRKLQGDPFAATVFNRAVQDDEDEKAWFYGALLREALWNGIVPAARVRYLRFARDVTAQDLDVLVVLARSTLLEFMQARRHAGASIEDTIKKVRGDLRDLGDNYQTLVQALVRWGFFSERSGTRWPQPDDWNEFARLLDIADRARREREAFG